MHESVSTQSEASTTVAYELRFVSLFQPGRGVAVPCDQAGKVNLDALSQRQRTAYLGARALLGRDYAYPTVQRTH